MHDAFPYSRLPGAPEQHRVAENIASMNSKNVQDTASAGGQRSAWGSPPGGRDAAPPATSATMSPPASRWGRRMPPSVAALVQKIRIVREPSLTGVIITASPGGAPGGGLQRSSASSNSLLSRPSISEGDRRRLARSNTMSRVSASKGVLDDKATRQVSVLFLWGMRVRARVCVCARATPLYQNHQQQTINKKTTTT